VVEVAAPAPVVEVAAPAPVVEVAAPAPVVEVAAPAPVVEVAAPAPVVEVAPVPAPAPAPVVEAPPAPALQAWGVRRDGDDTLWVVIAADIAEAAAKAVAGLGGHVASLHHLGAAV
jgi:hypothetical protein